MTENPMYIQDSYLKEFETAVESVKNGKFVVLKDAIFYPASGGQAGDTGKIIRLTDNQEFNVVFGKKFPEFNIISYEVDKEGLQQGDKVKCVLDWQRRHKLMRSHTATHVLCGVIVKHNPEAKITGNQLETDKTRIDFSLENYDAEKMKEYIEETNVIASEGHGVRSSFMPREKALKMPEMVKLANVLPPEVKELRILEIEGVDTQADGGTHVRNTKEIGNIEFVKSENKGKANRRLYFKLVD